MKLIRDSIIYLGTSIINKAIPFLLLPILTTYLSPEEYGILSIFLIIITFFGAFIGMNINVNISKNFFQSSQKEMGIIVFNCIVIVFSMFVLFTILTALTTLWVKDFFSIPSALLILIPLISFGMMLANLYLTLLRNRSMAIRFGLFEIAITILTMSITIVLLVKQNYGWFSQPVGLIMSYTLFGLLSIYYLKKSQFLIIAFSKKVLKELLRISVPLIPHVLGGVVIGVSDRLFIEEMIDIHTVGIYSVGYTFGLVVVLFTDAFIKAWSPWFYRKLSNPNKKVKRTIVKYTYLYIFSVLFIAIMLAIIGEFLLPFLVSEDFLDAKKYIFWVAIGYSIHGIYKIFYPYLVFLGRTSFLAKSTTIAAIINLVLNYVLIKEFGAIGAAYATIVAFSVSSLMVFLYQKKRYHMPWMLNLTSQLQQKND